MILRGRDEIALNGRLMIHAATRPNDRAQRNAGHPATRCPWSARCCSAFRRHSPSRQCRSSRRTGIRHQDTRPAARSAVAIQSPFGVCQEAPEGPAGIEIFKEIKNPNYIGVQAGLTQTTDWLDAWTFRPSVYAVAAETTPDVVAAVNFARTHDLRLVAKDGGRSYLGRSNAPDSLLIWTRHMNNVVSHDAFIAQGCAGQPERQPAVTIGAETIWGHAYNEVTTKGGHYVQGGGCLTVGVAGLVQAGGFGSFSKRFRTAATNLLEAEVVTADGAVRIANACTNPNLFWGIKGGGGAALPL